MKLLTEVLIACGVALAVYAARRRIMFALKTGALVYVVLMFGRLLLSMDRWEDLAGPVLLMLIAWAVLWVVSTNYAERRGRKSR